MIPNHPALYPDGTIKREWVLMLQEALIAEYTQEGFQTKLYAGWYATGELHRRHEWRQTVCMEVQSVILPRYGFEGSRRGVFASGVCCNCSPECADIEVGRNGGFMEWLVNPDLQESGMPPGPSVMANWFFIPPPKEGEMASSGYELCVTSPDDKEAIFNIARMQGVLAGAHQAMYQDVYPALEVVEWFGVLGINKGIKEALDSGILIYHAKAVDSGRIVGYISCTLSYGDGRAREPSEEEEADDERRPHGYISNLVVLDQHRGHGVGKLLFNELLDHLAQACPTVASDLRISVAERNARAKEWYERLGFAVGSHWMAMPSNCPVRFLKMYRRLDAGDFDDLFG